MRCPECGHAKSKCFQTVRSKVLGEQTILRRRKCEGCGKNFSSHEITTVVVERLRSDLRGLRTSLEMTRLRADELEERLNMVNVEVQRPRTKRPQPRSKANGSTCYDKKPMAIDDYARREAEAEARNRGVSVEQVLREWGPM
jgi:transcriptional regulator NrdR family protein